MKKQVQLKNGTRISYQEAGSGDTPIVLLHGYCGSSDYWHRVLPMLAASHRVIAVDLPGHGDSSAPGPGETYSIELFAENLHAWANEAGLDRFHLFGHSLGGYITLAFAERYADMLKSFGLIHSTPFPDDEAARQNRDKGAESIKSNGIEPFIKALIPKLFAPAHVQTMPEQLALAKEIGLATDPNGAILTLRAMRDRKDRLHVLQETALPVLLVAGKEDQVIPPEKTFVVQKAQIQQMLLPSAGHMGMLEVPNELAEAIQTFLEQLKSTY